MTAFTKSWIGTTGDYSLFSNWRQINIRSSAYAWTLSGSGTSEYYLRTAALGNPGIASPGSVLENGTALTSGSLGSLVASRYGYGDNDTLGYSTIYVRTSGSVDPDGLADGAISFRSIPIAGDSVVIPEDSGDITSGLDQSAVAIVDFIVEEGYQGTIGSLTGPLRIDPDRFVFHGGGSSEFCYIDLTTAVIPAEVRGTSSAGVGEAGLYLIGSAITLLDVQGGSVAFGLLPGLAATLTTGARTRGSTAKLLIGSAAVVPLLQCMAGEVHHENSIADILLTGGTVRTKRAAAVSGVVTVSGGTWYDQSTGTKASVIINGGNVDTTQAGGAVTWTALLPTSGTLKDDKSRLTITAITRPTLSGSFSWLRP